MKRDRINFIIEKAYGRRYDLEAKVLTARPRSRFYLTKVRPVITRLEIVSVNLLKRKYMLGSITLTGLLVLVTVYYYNQLVISEQNMHATMGRIQALLQRRSDTAANLSKAVLDYAEHERTVLNAVVALRGASTEKQAGGESLSDAPASARRLEQWKQIVSETGGKPGAPGKAPAPGASTGPAGAQAADVAAPSALMSLSALAEQYPDLKLSGNFQTLMNVLDQIEKDLAAERMKHDEMVNIYTTYVQTVPSIIFAKLFRFPVHPYFEASEEAKNFKTIGF